MLPVCGTRAPCPPGSPRATAIPTRRACPGSVTSLSPRRPAQATAWLAFDARTYQESMKNEKRRRHGGAEERLTFGRSGEAAAAAASARERRGRHETRLYAEKEKEVALSFSPWAGYKYTRPDREEESCYPVSPDGPDGVALGAERPRGGLERPRGRRTRVTRASRGHGFFRLNEKQGETGLVSLSY